MARWDSGITYDSGQFYDSEDVPSVEYQPTQPLRTMRQLVNFFKNPFDSKDISLAELCAFTTDTVGNLQEHNPAGVHDARITGITSTYSGVESCHGADLASLGTRKARKTAKSLFRESLPAATERVEISLKAAFGANAAEVQQAFPSGRTAFNRSTDDLLGEALGVMNAVVVANAAALPPAIVTLSAGLVTSWATLYAQSEAATAQKSYTEAEKRAARQVLQFQLYLTLVHLMATYPLQPEKLEQYMKQHLLEDQPSAADEEEEDEEPTPPTPTP